MTVVTPARPRVIPGPRPILNGNGQFVQLFRDPIRDLTARLKRYGRLHGMSAFNEGEAKAIVALGPEYNQQVLSDPGTFYTSVPKRAEGTALARLASGVIFVNGQTHKRQRRLVLPLFHKKYIENYHGDMVAHTARMLEDWQSGTVRNVARDMHHLTMHIANKTLFGLETHDDDDNIGAIITRWLALNTSPLSIVLPRKFPGSPYSHLVAVSERLERVLLGIIAEKRARGIDQDDVLSLLLRARDEDGSPMTDDELLGQANILFLAGHETSANALSWTLFLLSQHPQVMHDVIDELDGVLGETPPTLEQLNSLPLLERVLKESMRLLPPLPWIPRLSVEPFEMGGYQFPAGMFVVISHYITHHLPDIYERPEAFNPYRWETIDPSPYEYMPFSAGPRMCIGASFAMMEMKIVLAMVLQRFRVTLAPGTTVDRLVRGTLTPKHGLPMVIERQDRRFEVIAARGNIHESVELPR